MAMQSPLLSTGLVPTRRIWSGLPRASVHWAETIGPNTARLFERIMNDKPHPEMGYRGCLGIIRLAEKYSAQRVEAASERVAHRRVPVQKCRIDSEELAGSDACAVLTAR